jgi:hypothetical protein
MKSPPLPAMEIEPRSTLPPGAKSMDVEEHAPASRMYDIVEADTTPNDSKRNTQENLRFRSIYLGYRD